MMARRHLADLGEQHAAMSETSLMIHAQTGLPEAISADVNRMTWKFFKRWHVPAFSGGDSLPT